MSDTISKMQKDLQTIKAKVVEYKALFAKDGTIDAKEQAILNDMQNNIRQIEQKLNDLKSKNALREKLENGRKTATFHLIGHDIVSRINLLDASGEKILQTMELKRGYVFTGSFTIGEGQPVGEYIVQILGTHYPIVRGRVHRNFHEPLNDKEYVVKVNKDKGINVLIDFKQEHKPSAWHPEKQDNPVGSKHTFTVKPSFGIQKIQLMRTNSREPVRVWDIEPSKFQGDITVFLDDNKVSGQYPDDIYYFEVIGYNKGEILKSLEVEKIDELTLSLSWSVDAPPIKVALTIDFDPRDIYFIHEKNGEEHHIIPGERPYIQDVSFVSSDKLTKNLQPGNYKIRISGMSENQISKNVLSSKTYTKINPYSRFDVLIYISDNDLRGEVDHGEITSHLINLATRWWEDVVEEISKVIKEKCKKTEEIKGLFGHLEGTVVGEATKFFGGKVIEIAIMCEKSVCFIVNQILKYEREESLKGKPTIEQIIEKTEKFVNKAKEQFIITAIDDNEWFQSGYLREHKSLTTKKMLLQIKKDIDIIVAGKSKSQVVRDLISKK